MLHHQSLLCVIALLLVGQFLFSFTQRNFTAVLGKSIDISSQVLLSLTNQKRQHENLPTLFLNDDLSQAAMAKAKDMFTKNYWAHNAPDGTPPWYFIKQTGYEYAYAGENLARGFNTSSDVVDAWMQSISHRENMLSGNYTDVGFAFMQGKLLDEDTTLVVEMFGSKALPAVADAEQQQRAEAGGMNDQGVGSQAISKVFAIQTKPFFSSDAVSQNIMLMVIAFFIFILILDAFIIERKRIARLVGHNLDHIFFLTTILLVVLLYQKGIIL